MTTLESSVPTVGSAPPRSVPTVELPRRSDAFVIYSGILLLMLISALDALEFFDRPSGKIRYVILLAPISAALWVRARRPSWKIQKPTPGHLVVAGMVALGLAGSLFGMVFRNTADAPLPVFVPMSVGLLALLAIDGPTDREVGRTTLLLGRIGFVYVVMNFLHNTGALAAVSRVAGSAAFSAALAASLKYRNASAAFVAMAFACAIIEHRRRRLVLLCLMYAVIFASYPSATQLLIVCGTALTLLLTSRRASSLRTLVTATALISITALALLNLSAVLNLTSSYFAEVKKVDANSGRLDLASAGIADFQQSPLVGHLFTREAVAVRLRDGKALPYHDDFILFLAEGGLLGIGLLVSWMAYTEFTLLRRYREFMNAGDLDRARLIRILLVTINAFFIAIPFNPVLEGITRTATLFGLWAIAMSLGRPGPAPDP